MVMRLDEAIFSLRAMRRLAPDPIREDDLRYLVEAATQAPNRENRQDWDFLVITDADLRRELGAIYRDLGERFVRDLGLASGKLDTDMERVYRNTMALVEGMATAPAMILVCTRGHPPQDPGAASAYWGSVYPAIQNLMLAARSRGLGTTLTTLHKIREDDVRELLGIPDDVETVALIPIGKPLGRWGPPLRRPAREVTHWNRWNERRD